MECLIHSPAYNCVKMAWVAGVGRAASAAQARRDESAGRADAPHSPIIATATRARLGATSAGARYLVPEPKG